MRFARNLIPGRLAGAALLAAALLIPSSGSTKEPDVDKLMDQMEVAYIEVVKLLMISPIQDLADETPYERAGQWVEEITKIAAQMQKAEESAKDKSFLGLSRRLEDQSRDIEARLKEKRGEGLLPALLRLRATCFECHKKHRS